MNSHQLVMPRLNIQLYLHLAEELFNFCFFQVNPYVQLFTII